MAVGERLRPRIAEHGAGAANCFQLRAKSVRVSARIFHQTHRITRDPHAGLTGAKDIGLGLTDDRRIMPPDSFKVCEQKT